MKRIIWMIIFLIAIMLFDGCTNQPPPIVSTEPTVTPVITITPTSPVATTTPTMTPAIINPTASITIVTPDPKATFSLTKADFEKLKAPLTVWALANESYSNTDTDTTDYYDVKNGLTREQIADYAWYIAYAFDYFDPSTDSFSNYYNTSIKKYGIKEGDLRQTGINFYTPKKAINSILVSTFGKAALNSIDLNKDIFDGIKGTKNCLKDDIYITVMYESYPEKDVLGTMPLPVNGSENTEFTTSFTVRFDTSPPEIDNYNIQFKLRQDDASEWGYNITAFNMQRLNRPNT